MITVLHRGGYAQMITILHRGGSLRTPKSDYVICARPLKESVKKVLITADILIILAVIELQGQKCIKREVRVIYELVIYNIGGLYFPKLSKLFS